MIKEHQCCYSGYLFATTRPHWESNGRPPSVYRVVSGWEWADKPLYHQRVMDEASI